MDTVNTQESAASEAVTQAPEATQEQATVQETAAPEVNATDTAEEKLYAGKYKSVEDMEKAYQELNSKFTNTSQEKAELAKILNEAFLTPEPAVPQQQQNSDTDSYYQENTEESNPLNREIEQLKTKSAVQDFILTHGDANSAAMQEVLNTDPIVRSINSPEAKLEYAYLKSQNIASSKALAEAQKTAAQQAQAKIVEKQTAQVETVRKTEPADESSELKTRMTSGSVADREAARREYIRKYLV